jgi:hypothetical protein
MAARTHKIRHDEQTRAKIQAAQIINRMHACVMGEITLDAQQVSCAKTLLAKVLPDLQSTAITGDDGGPININVMRFADRNASK